MAMPITVEIADASADEASITSVFDYFRYIDETFSTYKDSSEVMCYNRGEISPGFESNDLRIVLGLSEETRISTRGYFDIRRPDGTIDPSGLVKGWAIQNAARKLDLNGFKHFYIDAGGDIQTRGRNADGGKWSIGIRDPRTEEKQIVKIIYSRDSGVATSGSYIRGYHIYNPHNSKWSGENEIVSATIVGPNIYEADRFATAAFAMDRSGIEFIEDLQGFEGYFIDRDGIATMTSGFTEYTAE